MNMLDGLKSKVARRLLKKETSNSRSKKGSNFSTADNIGLIFKHSNKARYDQVVHYIEYLKGEHGIRNVQALCYIEEKEKNIPVWLKRSNKLDIFSKKEVKWNMKPDQSTDSFCHNQFDILIDFSEAECWPISFVVASSKAKMKICRKSLSYSHFCDVLIDLDKESSTEKYLKEINNLLSTFNLK